MAIIKYLNGCNVYSETSWSIKNGGNDDDDQKSKFQLAKCPPKVYFAVRKSIRQYFVLFQLKKCKFIYFWVGPFLISCFEQKSFEEIKAPKSQIKYSRNIVKCAVN